LKGVLTHSPSSRYDDLPELQYQFPSTYLRVMREIDFFVYYEPRRLRGQSDASGRQAYFAVARVESIEADSEQRGMYMARIADYLEFERPVPYVGPSGYRESKLIKPDGSTNKGAFGRSVRCLPDAEFEAIVRAGFPLDVEPWEAAIAVENAAYDRPRVESIVNRPFRDRAFTRSVRRAYRDACAISGLRILNGGGRPEVDAAHIRPVASHGSDSVRNGLALSHTVHWMFDRGLLGVDEQFNVLVSPQANFHALGELVQPGRRLFLPDDQSACPHPVYLAWHRENVFKR
jgi:putative restriction endonuclease